MDGYAEMIVTDLCIGFQQRSHFLWSAPKRFRFFRVGNRVSCWKVNDGADMVEAYVSLHCQYLFKGDGSDETNNVDDGGNAVVRDKCLGVAPHSEISAGHFEGR